MASANNYAESGTLEALRSTWLNAQPERLTIIMQSCAYAQKLFVRGTVGTVSY